MAFDSYIFDMDGTLWDAVDSYCEVWNRTIEQLGLDLPRVTRERLAPLMGKPLPVIFDSLMGGRADWDMFVQPLAVNENTMMRTLGGKVYEGVRGALETLHRRGARLYMVSNCAASGLPNFLAYTGLGDLIADTLSLGQNGLDKADNIRLMVERHHLKSPVYVGDTQGDCDSAHAAGVPFVWAAYGFGKNVVGQDYTITTISQLTDIQV